MPGREFLNQLERRLEQLGGEDYIFDRIADGDRLKDIAADLGCSRPYLYNWRDREPFKEQRRAKWTEAMRLSGEAKLEEGEEILDDLNSKTVLTSADVSVGVARSNYRKWLAQVRDPEQFGERSNGAGMIINVQHLHLDALRSTAGRPQVSAPVVDADVVAIEEGAEVEENEVVKALKG